jgi:hypothetical protein
MENYKHSTKIFLDPNEYPLMFIKEKIVGKLFKG